MCLFALLAGLFLLFGPPACTAGERRVPPLPLPDGFPTVFNTAAHAESAVQKRLSALLGRFDAVAAAEVMLISGEDGPASLRILVRPSRGERFDDALVESMVRLAADAVAGVGPEAIVIVDSGGRLLFADGQIHKEPAPQRLPQWQVYTWPALAVAAALLGVVLYMPRMRRPTTSPAVHPLDFLASCNEADCDVIFADEHPELAPLVAAHTCGEARRRLERYLRSRGLTAGVKKQLDDRTLQTVARALREKLSDSRNRPKMM